MPTWEEILTGPSLVGRDYESFEDGDSWRGPIESITLNEIGKLLIVREWTAIATGWDNPGWKYLGHAKESSNPHGIDALECQPIVTDRGIAFCVMGHASCNILPEGDNLDPAHVTEFVFSAA